MRFLRVWVRSDPACKWRTDLEGLTGGFTSSVQGSVMHQGPQWHQEGCQLSWFPACV